MPRGDGTGPFGEGPMTGRAAGYCAGYATPGFAGQPGFGGGHYGAGFARGRGRGHRNRFYATGVPFSAYPAPGPGLDRDQELALLKNESERLKSALDTVEKRLQQLETETE